jgi:hypothetical protein
VTSAKSVGRVARPGSPWLLLCPPGTVTIDVRTDPVRAELASGELPVVLADQRHFSRRRLRKKARELGVVVEREFVVLPSIERPMVVIDDTAEAIRHFWTAVATVPPGVAVTALPASALLGLVRLLPWRLTGAAAPGRVVVGRRP